MACRNLESAEEAAMEIKSLNAPTKQVTGELVITKLDLSSLASVRAFAEKINGNEERIDILINNAGVWSHPSIRNQTEDGFEQTIGVNHFGPFLLTNLLIEKLANSPEFPSRIINVASRAHQRGKINLDDINSETQYNGMMAYNQSKLANILFTNELSQRLKENGQNISVYSLHPGVIHTNLFREMDIKYGLLAKFASILLWPFLKSSREGAQTTIYCATDETIINDTGKYYSDCKETETSPNAMDKATAKKLWELSEESVGLKMCNPS
jgi:NAD(P)-dependent dehydrogenase (short-subunit alcohol dehydrogenase family)